MSLKTMTTYYEDGKTVKENFHVDGNGILQGSYQAFYENGQLAINGNYKDGKEDGPGESYYENGQLKEKGTYKNGEIDGLCEFYYENGQPKLKCFFKNGKKEGAYETYYDNGQLKEQAEVKDDLANGVYKKYHKNGQLQESGTYKAAKRNGSWEFYDAFGSLVKTSFYNNGHIVQQIRSSEQQEKTERKTESKVRKILKDSSGISKEKFMKGFSKRLAEARKTAVSDAQKAGTQLSADKVMELRNAEEKKRWEANKILLSQKYKNNR